MPLINFAQQGNPTIQINLTRRYSFQLTYAEVLQYACILLTTRQMTILSRADGGTNDGGGEERNSSLFFYLNVCVLLASLASLGVRRKAEGLGLRRTSLMLCVVLFCLTGTLAALGHLASHPLAASPTTTGDWSRRLSWHQLLSSSRARRRNDEDEPLSLCTPARYGHLSLQRIRSACSTSTSTSTSNQLPLAAVDDAVRQAGEVLFGGENGLLERLCGTGRERVRLAHLKSPHSLVIECNHAPGDTIGAETNT